MRGVLGDQRERQNNRHVILGFLRQHIALVQLPEIRVAGALDGLLHVARAAIVGRHGQIPIAEQPVQIAQMLRRRTRGFFRILPLVDPPGMPQPVLLPAIGHELPHASRARARQRQRLERAFRLRQVDQILRDAFFMQHARDHLLITAPALQPGLDNRAAARRLEEIEKRQHFVIHRQRKIVRNIFGGLLGAFLQSRIDREGHLRDFIDRRRHRRSFLKSIASAEGLQFVDVNGIDHAVKQLAQLRIAVWVVAALEHQVHGFVEIFSRRFQVPGLVVLLAGSEFRLDLGDQIVFAARNLRRQQKERARCRA